MVKESESLDVVTKINDEIFDRLGGSCLQDEIELVYHTNGDWEAISLCEETIWCSEYEDRLLSDDGDFQESLESWVRKKIAERVRLLGKLLVLTEPVKEGS